MENNESMNIILEKVDQVATDTLRLLDENLRELGINDINMISALQYAIATKMVEKSSENLPK